MSETRLATKAETLEIEKTLEEVDRLAKECEIPGWKLPSEKVAWFRKHWLPTLARRDATLREIWAAIKPYYAGNMDPSLWPDGEHIVDSVKNALEAARKAGREEAMGLEPLLPFAAHPHLLPTTAATKALQEDPRQHGPRDYVAALARLAAFYGPKEPTSEAWILAQCERPGAFFGWVGMAIATLRALQEAAELRAEVERLRAGQAAQLEIFAGPS